MSNFISFGGKLSMVNHVQNKMFLSLVKLLGGQSYKVKVVLSEGTFSGLEKITENNLTYQLDANSVRYFYSKDNEQHQVSVTDKKSLKQFFDYCAEQHNKGEEEIIVTTEFAYLYHETTEEEKGLEKPKPKEKNSSKGKFKDKDKKKTKFKDHKNVSSFRDVTVINSEFSETVKEIEDCFNNVLLSGWFEKHSEPTEITKNIVLQHLKTLIKGVAIGFQQEFNNGNKFYLSIYSNELDATLYANIPFTLIRYVGKLEENPDFGTAFFKRIIEDITQSYSFIKAKKNGTLVPVEANGKELNGLYFNKHTGKIFRISSLNQAYFSNEIIDIRIS